MADPAEFVDDENWHGGYYELAIDLGARVDADADADDRLLAALAGVWSDPALEGCYLVGFEVSGEAAAGSVDEPMPEERWIGFVLPSEDGLRFFAANRSRLRQRYSSARRRTAQKPGGRRS